ncbi:hypothetical protein J437_LFUL016577 [Ladona fulva]|uniref:Reverse transcriptase n=1 Tax=Ladona fulva TaxID=123851 RepID=A0A8K0KJT1_LADFU|nr:hypothetical protein J437_LFUL016577 [Ladona fulva]
MPSSTYESCYEIKTTKHPTTTKNTLKKTWMNPSLLHMMKHRDQLFRRCKKAPANSVHRQAYVSYRNLVSSKIREAKNNYFKNLFSNMLTCSLRSKWFIINNRVGTNKSKTIDDSILKYFGQKSSAKKIADDFARSFVLNVQNAIHTCNYPKSVKLLIGKDINHCFYVHKINRKSLSNIIGKLNNNKPPGYDKIRVSDLKMMSSSLSPLLVKMINLSLESGTVPNDLKETIIRPVYKGGSVTNTNVV